VQDTITVFITHLISLQVSLLLPAECRPQISRIYSRQNTTEDAVNEPPPWLLLLAASYRLRHPYRQVLRNITHHGCP